MEKYKKVFNNELQLNILDNDALVKQVKVYQWYSALSDGRSNETSKIQSSCLYAFVYGN